MEALNGLEKHPGLEEARDLVVVPLPLLTTKKKDTRNKKKYHGLYFGIEFPESLKKKNQKR